METKKFNTDYLMLGLLVILIILAGAQTIQIDNLQTKSTEINQKVVEAKVTSQPVQAPNPAPTMVGGC